MRSTLIATSLRHARGTGKKAAARLARRILPSTTLRLSHVEPGLHLTVNLRRNVMFWTGGLGRYEPYTVDALRAAVEPGDTVLDVGANIGFFATLLSRRVGPRGRVLAFEPEPGNLALLRENLASNGCENVAVHPYALGARPGVASFSVDESTGSTGRLGDGATAGELAVGTGAVRLIEIAVETVDALAERQALAPALLKLDIEGGEIEALRGAERTLRARRPIVISELTGERGDEVVTFLRGLDYRLWDLESTSPVVPELRSFMVIALPGEAIETARARRILDALEARRRPLP